MHRNSIRFQYGILLLCMFSVFVIGTSEIYASDSVSILVGSASAKQGERITIPIMLNSNPGLGSLRIAIEYDDSRLRLESEASITRGTALDRLTFNGLDRTTFWHNPVSVIWTGTANDTSTGLLLDITFYVLDNAPAGNAIIDVSVGQRDANDNVGNPISVAVSQGVVAVQMTTLAVQPTPTPPPEAPGQDELGQVEPPPINDGTSENEMPSSDPSLEQEPGDTTPTIQRPNVPRPFPPIVAPQLVETAELPTVVQETIQKLSQESFENAPVFAVDSPGGGQQMRVLMSVPFVGETDVLPETIVAYRIELDGTIELIIPSLFDEANSVMWLLGYTNEIYMVTANFVEFADVERGRWYFDAITFATARELFVGVGNNRFAPQTTMTRAMFVTALSNLDGINPEAYNISPFSDVNIENWYGPPIAWAMQKRIIDDGILSNSVQGTFRPSDNITREEMAVIFANFLSVRDFPMIEQNVSQFYDLYQASPWARKAIQSMRRHSIIAGVGDNRYNPQSEATRAEVAQIFTNLINSIVGIS